ncbi:MAG: SUMF1/EgtB/PvdO family nonheme iron enzyme [Magnetococcales bacterium]|nr:SUMF1/EgtB/PvdO family nonheme iron enzyme [Magnetococcales bacterium]
MGHFRLIVLILLLVTTVPIGILGDAYARAKETKMSPGEILNLDISDPIAKKSFVGDMDMPVGTLEKINLSDPLTVVRMFVDFEFKGVSQVRHHFARFTPESHEEGEIRDFYHECEKLKGWCEGDFPSLGTNLSFGSEDSAIVSRYAILSIVVQGEHATAVVDYDRLATVSGDRSRMKMVIDPKEHEYIVLHLQKSGGQWRLVNPPPWHISIDALWPCRISARERFIGRRGALSHDDCAVIGHVFASRQDRSTLRNLLGDGSHETVVAATGSTTGAGSAQPFSAVFTQKLALSNPREVLQTFIRGEFNGNLHLRSRMVLLTSVNTSGVDNTQSDPHLTSPAPPDHSGVAHQPGRPIDLDRDPWFAVANYRLQHFKVEGNQALAEVDFDRHIETRHIGPLRRLFRETFDRDHDQITYRLVQKGQQWFIVDPPPPRMAVAALLRHFRPLEQTILFAPLATNPWLPLFQQQSDFYTLQDVAHRVATEQSGLSRHFAALDGRRDWIGESTALATRRRYLARQQAAWETRPWAPHLIARQNVSAPNPPDHGEVISDQPGAWRDPTSGLTFVWVPGGSFGMGCAEWSGSCFDDETPMHQVTLDGFWLATTPVTQGMWRAVMGNNPALTRRQHGGPVSRPHHLFGWDKLRHWVHEHQESLEDLVDYPAENVSQEDALRFIKKLNARSGQSFRLPTEAEWEYACRAGENMSGQDNEVVRQATEPRDTTRPVRGDKPNPMGIFDMVGGIHEWVRDFYDPAGYQRHAAYNPVILGRGEQTVRGGGFIYADTMTRPCSFRNPRPDIRKRHGPVMTGFRLARSR